MDKKVLIFTFLISLLGHCLFLFVPRFNFVSSPLKKWKDVVVEIEIRQPPVTSYQLPVTSQKLLKKKRQKRKEKKEKKIIEIQKPKKTKSQFKRKKVKKPYPGGHRQVTRSPSYQVTRSQVKKKTENRKQRTEKANTEKRTLRKISIQEKKEINKEKEFLSPVIKEVSEADFVLENGRKEALLRYQDRIKQKIESCKRYPRWAKKQGFEGIVYLGFTILSNGEVRDIRIVHPSQFDILNKEALTTVRRASPFLPIPQNLNCSFIEMEVSVVFKLR